MKIKSYLFAILILLAIFMDQETVIARRSGGSRSSGGRSSSGGSRRSTTTTTRTMTRRDGSSFSGSRFYVDYRNYMPVGMVVGMAYYDRASGWYYDGQYTYRSGGGSSIVTVVVILFVCVCIVLIAIYGKGGHGEDYDDDYHEETVVTTTVVEEDGGPQASGYGNGQTFAPGTNPPGTILCNSGHIFTYLNTNPYGDDSSTCDNCQNVIQFGYGGFHCGPCEVDLCSGCGQGRGGQAVAQQQFAQPGM